MIEFKNLQLKFGDFTAIENLNLTIYKNEFFTFLGPSGSGKSTTLNALAGFLEPSKGQIFLEDKDITKQPIEKREIGMVFQSYALFPSLNVYENIAFGLRVQKKEKQAIDQRVKELAKLVDLTDEQLNKEISALSGGQQQRVAIARGLAQGPKILLLDEPLSNLDAKLRKQLRSELKSIQNKYGITMIYVTHDQDEALSMSDRIAVFNNGKVEHVGTPFEIYNSPKTEFTNDFLGNSNKLTPSFIEEVNHQTGSQLEPNKLSYIREEHVTNVPHNDEKHAEIEVDLQSYEYYGSITKYTFKYKDTLIRTFEKSDSKQYSFDLSQRSIHKLYINPSDINQFNN